MPLTNFPNGTDQYYLLSFPFGIASTAQTSSLPVPHGGTIKTCYVVTGSVASVAAAYTVRFGSAGSVSVATVTGTALLAGAQEALTTTAVTVTTASGIVVSRGVTGSEGDTIIGLVVQRTV